MPQPRRRHRRRRAVLAALGRRPSSRPAAPPAVSGDDHSSTDEGGTEADAQADTQADTQGHAQADADADPQADAHATATPTPTPTPTAATPHPADAPGRRVPNLVGTDPVWHLLRRATFGPTPALVAEVKTLGTTAWLDQQLAPASHRRQRLRRLPHPLPDAADDDRCRSARPSRSTPGTRCTSSAARRSPGRCSASGSCFEVMVEFWSNHFNVATPDGEVWDLKTVDDRDVIRKHALGTFSDMLLASAQSPAMLQLPEQRRQQRRHPQRELRPRAARAAHRRHRRRLHPRRGHRLRAHHDRLHRRRPRRVRLLQRLALRRPGQGARLQRPERRRIRRPHARPAVPRLPGEPPEHRAATSPPSSPSASSPTPRRRRSITALAKVYLANDTAIVPVLKALFTSAEFAASIGQKTRRPDRRPDRRRPHARRHARRRRRQQPAAALLAAEPRSGRRRWAGIRRTATPTSPAPGCRPAACCAAGTRHIGRGRRLVDGRHDHSRRRHPAAAPPHRRPSAPSSTRCRTRLLGTKLDRPQRSAVITFACSRTAGITENSAPPPTPSDGTSARSSPDPQLPELDPAMSTSPTPTPRRRPMLLRRAGLTRRSMLAAMGVTAGAVAVSPLAVAGGLRRRRLPTPATCWSCCRCTAGGTPCRSSRRSATRTTRRCGRTSASRRASRCRRRRLRPAPGARAAEAVLRQRPARRRARGRPADRRPQPLPGRGRARAGRARHRRRAPAGSTGCSRSAARGTAFQAVELGSAHAARTR